MKRKMSSEPYINTKIDLLNYMRVKIGQVNHRNMFLYVCALWLQIWKTFGIIMYIYSLNGE